MSRGYASQTVEQYEPTENEKHMYEKMGGKDKDYVQMKEDIEKNMEKMGLEGYEEEDDTLQFTSELEALKKKEMGN